MEMFPFFMINDIEITINTSTPGFAMYSCVTHRPNLQAVASNILDQKSSFMHTHTPLVSGTVVKSFPMYAGQTKILRPFPVDGQIPIFMLATNTVADGSVQLIINFDYGGMIIMPTIAALSNVPPRPPQEPILIEAPGPTVTVAHDDVLEDLINSNGIAGNDTSRLKAKFNEELLEHGLSQDQVGATKIVSMSNGVGTFQVLKVFWDNRHALYSVGKVLHDSFRVVRHTAFADEKTDEWYYGLLLSPPASRIRKEQKPPQPRAVGGSPIMV